jgi:hypothetical protein
MTRRGGYGGEPLVSLCSWNRKIFEKQDPGSSPG